MEKITYWKGVLLSEVPREELEQALIETSEELERERTAHCNSSIGEIKALAALRREQLRPVLGIKF